MKRSYLLTFLLPVIFFWLPAANAVWNDYVWDYGASTTEFTTSGNWSPDHTWTFSGEDQAAVIQNAGAISPRISSGFAGHPTDLWFKIGTSTGPGKLTLLSGADVQALQAHMPWSGTNSSYLTINSGAALEVGTISCVVSGTGGSTSNILVSGDLIADRILAIRNSSETNIDVSGNGKLELADYIQTSEEGTLNISLDGSEATFTCEYLKTIDPDVYLNLEYYLDGEYGVGINSKGIEMDPTSATGADLSDNTSMEVYFNGTAVPGTYTVMTSSDISDPTNGNMMSSTFTNAGWSYSIVDNDGVDELKVTYAPEDIYYDTVYADNPDVWYKMNDETSLECDIADDAENTLDGIYEGSVSLFNAGLKKAAWFNGYDAGIDLGSGLRDVLDGASAVTVEAWIRPVNPDVNNIYYPILSYRVDNGSAGLDLRLKYSSGNVVLTAGVRSCAADSYQTRETTVDIEDSWHHIACVIDYPNDTIKMYVDANSAATWSNLNFSSNTYSPGTGVTQYDQIGRDCSETYYYRGFIDELAIYSRELSSSEISDHYDDTIFLGEYSKWNTEIANNGGADTVQKNLEGPSIVKAPDGSYVASFVVAGSNSGNTNNSATIYNSTNKGKTWQQISNPAWTKHSTLFEHDGDLYIFGLEKGRGDIHIKRSEDYGDTWTVCSDSSSGKLFEPTYSGNNWGYLTAPTPVVDHDGRIYRAFEQETQYGNQWPRDFAAFVISAPNDCNLLDASNWTKSNIVSWNSSWEDDWAQNWLRGGWLEGGIVYNEIQEQLYLMIRVNSEPYVNIAALLEISSNGSTVTFDPDNDFIDMPGGMSKFSVRYDPASKLYLSLVNNNIDPDGSLTQRNMVSLIASADLRNWEVLSNDVQCDRPISWDESLKATGFQYIDWQFDGDDIIYVSRTAYDTTTSNPDKAWHNANKITFHRIRDYLSICPEVPLVDSFENGFAKWTDGGTTDWNTTTYSSKSGDYSAHAGYDDNDLISDNIDASGYSSMTVTVYYRDDDIDDGDNVYLQFRDNASNYDSIFELGNSAEDVWNVYRETIYNEGTDAQYFHSNFRLKFEASSIDGGESLWIDDVSVVLRK